MIEELANYGALGMWTIFNITTILYYRKKEEQQNLRLTKVIENNTIMMSRVYEVVTKCAK